MVTVNGGWGRGYNTHIDFEKLRNEHPYKVPGNLHETSSQYNKGWSDAIDRVQALIERDR